MRCYHSDMTPKPIMITRPYRHQGEEIIRSFDGLTEVMVRRADPDWVGAERKQCIDNALELAELGDFACVQGFIRLKQDDVGFFHYWCWDPERDQYWDATPIDKDWRYYIKLYPKM